MVCDLAVLGLEKEPVARHIWDMHKAIGKGYQKLQWIR